MNPLFCTKRDIIPSTCRYNRLLGEIDFVVSDWSGVLDTVRLLMHYDQADVGDLFGSGDYAEEILAGREADALPRTPLTFTVQILYLEDVAYTTVDLLDGLFQLLVPGDLWDDELTSSLSRYYRRHFVETAAVHVYLGVPYLPRGAAGRLSEFARDAGLSGVVVSDESRDRMGFGMAMQGGLVPFIREHAAWTQGDQPPDIQKLMRDFARLTGPTQPCIIFEHAIDNADAFAGVLFEDDDEGEEQELPLSLPAVAGYGRLDAYPTTSDRRPFYERPDFYWSGSRGQILTDLSIFSQALLAGRAGFICFGCAQWVGAGAGRPAPRLGCADCNTAVYCSQECRQRHTHSALTCALLRSMRPPV